jgi:hypothetical protein
MAVENNPYDNSFVISYLELRVGLGIVGFFLPFILISGAWLFSECGALQPSISHYYYTVMGSYFVGSLCAVAMFLFFYKGYEKKDAIVANIAGVLALIVAFFPTDPVDDSSCAYFVFVRPHHFNTIHYTAAALLFSSFAYFSLVLFTKSKPGLSDEENKKIRNSIYKICGTIIIACILLIGTYNFLDNFNKPLYQKISFYKPVLFLETIALVAFGTSWITKGEIFLRDNK